MSYFTLDKGIYQRSVRFVKKGFLRAYNFINPVKKGMYFNYNLNVMNKKDKHSAGPKTIRDKAVSSRNSLMGSLLGSTMIYLQS